MSAKPLEHVPPRVFGLSCGDEVLGIYAGGYFAEVVDNLPRRDGRNVHLVHGPVGTRLAPVDRQASAAICADFAGPDPAWRLVAAVFDRPIVRCQDASRAVMAMRELSGNTPVDGSELTASTGASLRLLVYRWSLPGCMAWPKSRRLASHVAKLLVRALGDWSRKSAFAFAQRYHISRIPPDLQQFARRVGVNQGA